MKIRDASSDDAEASCQVLRRSITELCVADHGNDTALLSGWLRNKTPEIFRSWVAQPRNSVLIAHDDAMILAVGSVTDSGEITLNYVSPDARFRSVSKAMMQALEARAHTRGASAFTLTSTETARRFYFSIGYVENGPPQRSFGASSAYPMKKPLPQT